MPRKANADGDIGLLPWSKAISTTPISGTAEPSTHDSSNRDFTPGT